MSLTSETRKESYLNLDSETSTKHILEVLKCGKALTAREVSVILYEKKLIPYPVRQATAPRLTELEAAGVIEAVGKVYDEESKRNVAAYRIKN